MIIKLDQEMTERKTDDNKIHTKISHESVERAENDAMCRIKIAEESAKRAEQNSKLSIRLSESEVKESGENSKLHLKILELENKVNKMSFEKMEPKKEEPKKEEPKVVKPQNCPSFEFYTTNVLTEPLNTLSGGYNGSELMSSENNSEQSIVPGTIAINGFSETLPASFIFSGYRYAENNLFEETLKILTPKGSLIAEALYLDEGDSILSVTPYADYDVHTSWGELRETKGHKIRIYFDNTEPCKPRTLALVPGFGPDQKKAKLLQEKDNQEVEVEIPTFDTTAASKAVDETWSTDGRAYKY